MGIRGWPAWFGLWAAGLVGMTCVLARSEALYLQDHPRRYVDHTTATDQAIVAIPVLVALLVPWGVGLVVWHRWPLAGAVAVVRGWWSAAAVSVVGGAALAVGCVVTAPDIWRLMW